MSLTAKDFSSLDTYNLYLGLKEAIQNGAASGEKKQIGRTLVADDEVQFIDKTKVSINCLSGVILVTIFDIEDVLLYSFTMTPENSVYNFESFGNPINKILVQSDTLTDIAEVIFTNK